MKFIILLAFEKSTKNLDEYSNYTKYIIYISQLDFDFQKLAAKTKDTHQWTPLIHQHAPLSLLSNTPKMEFSWKESPK